MEVERRELAASPAAPPATRLHDDPERVGWVPSHPREEAPTPVVSAALAWLRLAVGSLMLAGLLALVLVAARLPGISSLVSDPHFAKRCLVLHVNLALGVWLVAFLAALAATLPGPRALLRGSPPLPLLAMAGLGLAFLPAAIPGVRPVLSNYVPALDHPLFLTGLALFALAVSLLFIGRLAAAMTAGSGGTASGDLPPAAAAGIKAALVIFLMAMATLWISAFSTTRAYASDTYYELLFWGAGHLLQSVHVAGMLVCWILLIARATGKAPVGVRTAGALFTLLAAPSLIGPVLAAGGTHLPAYHEGFTLIMRWSTWPVVLAFLALCLRHLHRAGACLRGGTAQEPYLVGFRVSALLTVTGFGLGALIRGPDTMVPAHYHAAVGGVTAAYMAAAFLLAGRLGFPRPAGRAGRLLPWQPGLYGGGQLLFALGFGFAGWHGAARKAYGSEQLVRSLPEQAGLLVMGLGGLVAVAGGLIFLWLLGGMLASRPTDLSLQPGERHG